MDTKKIMYGLGMVLLFAVAVPTALYSQTEDQIIDQELPYLSPEQKQLLKDQQKLLNDNKALFKTNLTAEQVRMLNDRSMSVDRRTTLLRQSLSRDQLNFINQNRQLIRSKRNLFKRTLTARQKSKLRHYIAKRNIRDRKRLLRRLRILIQNNMD